jgi:hypothetical protein
MTAVDLSPVMVAALVVVARMLHVHSRRGEHGVAGHELVELVVVNGCPLIDRWLRARQPAQAQPVGRPGPEQAASPRARIWALAVDSVAPTTRRMER